MFAFKLKVSTSHSLQITSLWCPYTCFIHRRVLYYLPLPKDCNGMHCSFQDRITLSSTETKQHGNADTQTSRLPLATDVRETESGSEIFDSPHIFFLTQLKTLSVSAKEVKHRTARAPVPSGVLEAIMRVQNDITDKDLHPYLSRRQEIAVHQGLLLWRIRVIIPELLHKEILL